MLWFGLYKTLEPFSYVLVKVLPLELGSHAYNALQPFFYDTPKVLLLLAGITIGAGIHGYVLQDFMASLMGKEAGWWSVPVSVLIGVPMYTNAAGIVPIVEALLAKGASLGTVLAFMMSVITLSLPEMIILRKVLKLRLIAVFVGVVSTGIMLVGFIFNAVL